MCGLGVSCNEKHLYSFYKKWVKNEKDYVANALNLQQLLQLFAEVLAEVEVNIVE